MPLASGAAPGCPVCALPSGLENDCAGCGWTLRSPRRPGPLTAGLQQDFSRRLTAAQHQFDVHAAARISADRLAFPQLRGGSATSAEWTAATAAADRGRQGAADEQQLRDIVTTVLLGLGTTSLASRAAAGQAAPGPAGDRLSHRRDRPGRCHADPGQPGRVRHAATAYRTVQRQLGRPAADVVNRGRRAPVPAGWRPDGGGQGRAVRSPRPGVPQPDRAVRPGDLLAGRGTRWKRRRCWPGGWRSAARTAQPVRVVRALAPAADLAAPGSIVVSAVASAPLLRPYGVPVAVADPRTGEVRTTDQPAVPGRSQDRRRVSADAAAVARRSVRHHAGGAGRQRRRSETALVAVHPAAVRACLPDPGHPGRPGPGQVRRTDRPHARRGHLAGAAGRGAQPGRCVCSARSTWSAP